MSKIGEEKREFTGYPSIDKPWMKYYDEEALKRKPFEGSMYDYLWFCNKDKLDAKAISYFGKTITYAKLFSRIDQCARALTAAGITVGDSIGVALLPVPEAVVLLYAANKIGVTFTAISVVEPVESMVEKLQAQSCRMLFASNGVVERLEKAGCGKTVPTIAIPLWQSASVVPRFVMKAKAESLLRRRSNWSRFLSTQANDIIEGDVNPAVVVYTGGTTGKPKGVPISNRAANTVASYYASGVFEFEPGERFLDIMPPFLAYGIFAGIHMPLCLGMELVMCPDVRPAAFPSHVIKYKPHHVTAGPNHLDALMSDKRAASMDLSFMKTSGYGGDSAAEDWENRFSEFLLSHGAPRGVMKGYGMTEVAGPFCSTTHSCSQMIPFPGSEIMIFDFDSDEELSYGQVGEICVSGDALMEGYLDTPCGEQNVMFERAGRRWMHSGDLGRISTEGHFEILGRIKRILYVIGDEGIPLRVYPREVEETIARHPAVSKCSVVGTKCFDGYEVIAFVVLHEGSVNFNCKQLRSHCSGELPSYAVPSKFVFVESLPYTGAGKVDDRKLEQMASELSRHE